MDTAVDEASPAAYQELIIPWEDLVQDPVDHRHQVPMVTTTTDQDQEDRWTDLECLEWEEVPQVVILVGILAILVEILEILAIDTVHHRRVEIGRLLLT